MADIKPWKIVTPANRDVVTQCIAIYKPNNYIGVQSYSVGETDIDDMFITKYINDVPGEVMNLPKRGHGTQLLYNGRQVTFRASITKGDKVIDKTWVRIPWIAGKTWKQSEVMKYAMVRPSSLVISAPVKEWFQGEISIGSNYYRLYGTPYKAAGPLYGNVPARLEIFKKGKLSSKVDLSHLGRVDDKKENPPVGGRLEPEGLSSVVIDNISYVVIGFCINMKGSYQHSLYLMQS